MTDPVERSDALDKRLENKSVEDIIKSLVASSRTKWQVIWGLIISLVLDVALSVIVGFIALQAERTASLTNSVKTQVAIACQASNQVKLSEQRMWEFILSFPPTETLTPDQKAQRDAEIHQFRTYLQKYLSPQDCSIEGQGQ